VNSQRHVIEALLEGHPDAIKSREDKLGRLPLHIACINTASAQVLRLLVETYEESLRITDRIYGRLPLHFSCMYGSPFEILLLVSAEQRALVFKDVNGKTPKDLAEESSNPHRETILKRLEDRTREVRGAMIQRRKQQHQESPPLEAKKRSTLRRASSKRGIVPLKDIQATNLEKRRAKSAVLGSVDDETNQGKRRAKSVVLGSTDDETSRKGDGRRTKSMGLGLTEEKNIRTIRTIKGGEQRRQKLRRPHAVDDLDIGKTSKPSRRNRLGSKTSSRRKTEPHTVAPITARVTAADIDHEKTPQRKNGRGLLSQKTENSKFDTEEQDSKMKSKKSTNRLAMFLQSQEVDSSEGEYEADHKSMGARSLPAHMHSAFPTQKPLGDSETKRIAKTFMFPDSSDDSIEFEEQVLSSTKGAHDVTESESTNDQRKSADLVGVDDRLRNLGIRRVALSQECEAIYDTVAKKENAAQRSRDVISDTQRRIIELQEKLQKEQTALSLLETGIQLQKETLAVHEIKIRGVHSEKIRALEEKAKLEETTQEPSAEILE
jgi:hypothetical protein